MYRDLLEHEDLIAGHPLIQALALGNDAPERDDLAFEEPPDDSLDEVAPPEQFVSVLDADSTQRKCILSARQGHSFVMDGPPGTGKSQTIANTIAELIHSGRTVLFVSEKAAALDVVRDRLREAGLSDFALELHSHKATRKAVATDLNRALSSRPQARSVLSNVEMNQLVESRVRLSQYATALNQQRTPLGRSVYDAIGRVAQLQHVPQAPIPAAIGQDLEAADFVDMMDAAGTLSRHWGPVTRGDAFLWRDLAQPADTLRRRQELHHRAEEAIAALGALRLQVTTHETDLRLAGDRTMASAHRLAQVLDHLPAPAAVPEQWLTSGDIVSVRDRAEALEAATQRYLQDVAVMSDEGGDCWESLSPSVGEAAWAGWKRLGDLRPAS